MKKITTFLCLLFAVAAMAQTPCTDGRYASDIFSAVTTTSNITYGSNTSFSGATTTLRLDFYEPTGDTFSKRPLIIWVHGGSFIGGSRTDVDVVEFSQRFAKKGYACASISYRLGFFPFDSANAVRAVVRAVQDLRASLRFFYKDAQTADIYKIDTNQIYIGGSSAGAITALHLAYLHDECELTSYLSQSVITQLGGLEGNSGNPGYSSKVKGVINGCGALARYSWLEAGNVPLCSVHGTNDATVKYNRGIVNPGTPLMYLDGSRMLHERSCAVGLEHQFYTFLGAPHVPYVGNQAYMDTTVNFIRDFLIKQIGCTDAILQAENAMAENANLYAVNYCSGNAVNEICGGPTGIVELNKYNALIYPNPTKDFLTIIPSMDGAYSVELYDFTGRRLLVVNNENAMTELNLNGIGAGTYIIRVSSGKESYTEKLVKY
jgi:hypothetical protein